MKKLLTLLLLFFSSQIFGQYNICQETKQMMLPPNATGNIDHNARSDTFDIVHYDVTLDLTRLPNRNIKGVARIVFIPLKMNLTRLNLDLLELQVDSIDFHGLSVSYSHNDTLLGIQFPGSLPIGVQDTITIHYSGIPVKDPANWGGVHHDTYTYNLGVGFGSNPHVIGRAWHPCFDNFVERATYDLHILCRQPRKAYANGLLVNSGIVSGDTARFDWQLDQSIPTYLASWSVANYAEVSDTYQGLYDTIPIVLAALASDTSDLKGSFQNLKNVLVSLEAQFGPYRWDKVGYTMTTVGAMEHATSIHYPVSTVDGTTAAEDLMVHELAHHWFGNLITCGSAEEMWINEGWAEFVSHYYTEPLYGRNQYELIVQNNASLVLDQAHVNDGGFLALDNVPWDQTYGTTVYQKGAMVAHNLRGYLGDTLFFDAVKQVMALHAFEALSIDDFKVALENASGKDLDPFFRDWVDHPGFPVFRIDSVRTSPTTLFNKVQVGISNASYGTNHIHRQIPVNLALLDSNGFPTRVSFNWGGNDTVVTFFLPSWIRRAYLYPNNEVLTGVTRNELQNFSTGTEALTRTKAIISGGPNTQLDEFVIEYHYSGPKSTAVPTGVRLHPERYWRISGIFTQNEATLNLPYRGVSVDDPDHALLKGSEDSIRLFYRQDAAFPWVEYPHYTKQGGSSLDKKGVMVVSRVEPGDYVFANTDPNLSIPEEGDQGFLIFPNPTEGKLVITWKSDHPPKGEIEVHDLRGRLIDRFPIMEGPEQEIELTEKGVFLVSALGMTQRIIVQ